MSNIEEVDTWSAFDAAAACYDRVRPGYPDRAIREALRVARLTEESRILEVGCGTGQATLQFARMGLGIVALEPGPSLARLAQSRLAGFPKVEIRLSSFEALPHAEGPFEAILAASSFRWLDPDTRIERAAASLEPGSHLVLLENVRRLTWESYFERERDVLRAHAPGWPQEATYPSWQEIPEQIDEVERDGWFTTRAVTSYDWRISYPRDRYEEFLRTDPRFRELEESERNALVADLGLLIDRDFEGRVVAPYRTILHVARRTGRTA